MSIPYYWFSVTTDGKLQLTLCILDSFISSKLFFLEIQYE
jgi:hypothetical protein